MQSWKIMKLRTRKSAAGSEIASVSRVETGPDLDGPRRPAEPDATPAALFANAFDLERAVVHVRRDKDV
ncbi:MAG: hypothetical protein ACOC7V_15110, partial [Spirochaetota bacterium]